MIFTLMTLHTLHLNFLLVFHKTSGPRSSATIAAEDIGEVWVHCRCLPKHGVLSGREGGRSQQQLVQGRQEDMDTLAAGRRSSRAVQNCRRRDFMMNNGNSEVLVRTHFRWLYSSCLVILFIIIFEFLLDECSDSCNKEKKRIHVEKCSRLDGTGHELVCSFSVLPP